MKVQPLILSTLLCASCIYPYDMEMPAQEWALTVEGDILIGEVSVFRLGRLSPLDGKGDDLTPVWALCWIEDDEGTVYRPLDFHRSDSARIDLTQAPPDRAYRLHITENFTAFSYSTPWLTPLPAPHLDSISFARDPLREEVSVRVSLTGTNAESPYVQVDYVEEYQFHSLFVPKVRYVPNEGYYRFDSDYPYWCYREVPSREPQLIQLIGNGSGKAVNHSLLKRKIGSEPLQKQYAVDVTARAISQQAYVYRHEEGNGSDLTGDLFTPTPSRLRGNIRCENDPEQLVIGYVDAVCTVHGRRLLLNRSCYKDIPAEIENEPFLPDTLCLRREWELSYDSPYWNSWNGTNPFSVWNFQYHVMGMIPFYSGSVLDAEGKEMIPAMIWSSRSCADCTLRGGNLKRPDDWPEEEG